MLNKLSFYNNNKLNDISTYNVFEFYSDTVTLEDNKYSYDELGTSSGELPTTAVMAIYEKKTNGIEQIKEVTFATAEPGNYEIYLYRGYAKKENILITEMEHIGTGRISYSGYQTHKITSDVYIAPTTPVYSIVVKQTADNNQGIFFYIKDIQTNEIWSAAGEDNCDQFSIQFMPDKNQFEKVKGKIKTKLKTTVDANEPVELRRLEIQNNLAKQIYNMYNVKYIYLFHEYSS